MSQLKLASTKLKGGKPMYDGNSRPSDKNLFLDIQKSGNKTIEQMSEIKELQKLPHDIEMVAITASANAKQLDEYSTSIQEEFLEIRELISKNYNVVNDHISRLDKRDGDLQGLFEVNFERIKRVAGEKGIDIKYLKELLEEYRQVNDSQTESIDKYAKIVETNLTTIQSYETMLETFRKVDKNTLELVESNRKFTWLVFASVVILAAFMIAAKFF